MSGDEAERMANYLRRIREGKENPLHKTSKEFRAQIILAEAAIKKNYFDMAENDLNRADEIVAATTQT